jgi:predicted amidophosphoribosyltransferase
MAETTTENIVCENCGADVRENTVFCYNCGERVTAEEVDEAPHVTADTNGSAKEEMSHETRDALDDLAERLKQDEADSTDKLAAAAAERRKARVSPRKKKEVVWEPADDGPGILFVLITLLICVISAVIVLLTVYWK